MDHPSPFKRNKPAEDSIDGWLMSYADMITLLLCFFVIFVSTSEPKKDQLAAATRGMQARFGTVDLSTPFDGALRAIQGIIEDNKSYQAMSVEKTERGLILELSSDKFFIDNTAELKPQEMQALIDIVGSMSASTFKDYDIIIAGYTDDAHFGNDTAFKSAWDLTSAQAATMARTFVENGVDPKRIIINANGAQRPKVPNLDNTGTPVPENQARNRRVVISLERKL